MVEIERLPEGGYRVSRVFATKAAMQAGASALERIVPEAYEPLPVATRLERDMECLHLMSISSAHLGGKPIGGAVDSAPSPIEPRLNGIRDTAK